MKGLNTMWLLIRSVHYSLLPPLYDKVMVVCVCVLHVFICIMHGSVCLFLRHYVKTAGGGGG